MNPIRCHITFTDPIYRAEIHVYIGDASWVEPRFKRRWGIELNPKAHHGGESFRLQTKETGFISYIVWLNFFNWRATDQAGLVHELEHTTHKIFKDRGIKQTNDEVRAYYMDYLMKTVLLKLSVFHRNSKRKKKAHIK